MPAGQLGESLEDARPNQDGAAQDLQRTTCASGRSITDGTGFGESAKTVFSTPQS
jgi:hypothetical protein